MEGYHILLFSSLRYCFGEWVLLPSVSPIKNFESQFSRQFQQEPLPQNYTYANAEFCSDLHNLTTMSYGTLFKEGMQSRTGWEISLEDVEDLLKESEKLPESNDEKAVLVKQMGENLMTEAEQQIKTLFSPSRAARTKHFHFQSMESALMTISLLLFGVYLSKLIFKLLQSHYNRYNGGVAMMTGIRAPITFTHKRREGRSIQLQKIHLMHLIDKYNSRFN